MRTILVNLSNWLYEDSRNRLNASARKFGITEIVSYDFEDLKGSSFYNENRNILDRPVGLGYWLWKPFIILEGLKTLEEGDILIYSDSGIEIIDDLAPLIGICREREPVLLFANGNLKNYQWTKRDCFLLLDCDKEEFWKAPHVDASFCLFRKSDAVMQFVSEWLNYCRDERILTDMPNVCGKTNLPGFIEHQRDQPVLSLMAAKYRIDLYRMPSQFGNHYKMAEFRVQGEFNCVNQTFDSVNQTWWEQVSFYSAAPKYNSFYFQLLNHHRSKSGSL